MNQIKIGSLLSYISIFISNIVGITYTPIMLRMLGQSEYGVYSLVMTIVSYLALMDFGFGTSIVRYTSLYIGTNRTQELPSLYGLFFVMYSIVGVLTFVTGLILFYNINFFFSKSLTIYELAILKKMLLMVIIYITLSFPFSVFSAIVTSHEKFIFQKFLNIIRAILTPLLMIPLLLIGYKSVAMVAVFISIGVLISLSNLWFCFGKLKIKVSFRNFNRNLLQSILGFSVFVFLKNIFERIYWSSGQVMLATTMGAVSVAIFSIAIQIKGYYETFGKTIGNLFLPRVVKIISSTDTFEEFNLLFIKIGRIIFHILGFILVMYLLIGDIFISLWAGSNYSEAYFISVLILAAYTIPLTQILASQMLQALNKLKFQVLVFSIIAVLTIILNSYFIDNLGTKGAAISLSVSIIIGEVIILNIYYWKLGINILGFWKEIFIILVPMTVFLLISKIILKYLTLNNFIDLVIFISLSSLFYSFYIYKTGMNSYEKSTIKETIIRIKNKL